MTKVSITPTGVFHQNEEILRFTLVNQSGMQVQLINYGGIVTSIIIPDKNGIASEVSLGFEDVGVYLSEEYISQCPYFGAVAGRFANRIAGGSFHLDGKHYQLTVNNGNNCLHGGLEGFDKKMWKSEIFSRDDNAGVILSYTSPHLEEGFPGNLNVKTIVSLSNDNALCFRFEATTDHNTIVNLTNHCYFNFNGCADDIKKHALQINGTQILETKDLIPTGQMVDVKDTAFDFREFKTIGKDFNQLAIGYDNSFVVSNNMEYPQARLFEPESGRRLDVYSDQPSIQFYTGHYIPQMKGHQRKNYGRYMGLALEAQAFPDAPNQAHFPSVVLQAGDLYQSNIRYQFSWE